MRPRRCGSLHAVGRLAPRLLSPSMRPDDGLDTLQAYCMEAAEMSYGFLILVTQPSLVGLVATTAFIGIDRASI